MDPTIPRPETYMKVTSVSLATLFPRKRQVLHMASNDVCCVVHFHSRCNLQINVERLPTFLRKHVITAYNRSAKNVMECKGHHGMEWGSKCLLLSYPDLVCSGGASSSKAGNHQKSLRVSTFFSRF